jgi:hypothetical protein
MQRASTSIAIGAGPPGFPRVVGVEIAVRARGVETAAAVAAHVDDEPFGFFKFADGAVEIRDEVSADAADVDIPDAFVEHLPGDVRRVADALDGYRQPRKVTHGEGGRQFESLHCSVNVIKDESDHGSLIHLPSQPLSSVIAQVAFA